MVMGLTAVWLDQLRLNRCGRGWHASSLHVCLPARLVDCPDSWQPQAACLHECKGAAIDSIGAHDVVAAGAQRKQRGGNGAHACMAGGR